MQRPISAKKLCQAMKTERMCWTDLANHIALDGLERGLRDLARLGLPDAVALEFKPGGRTGVAVLGNDARNRRLVDALWASRKGKLADADVVAVVKVVLHNIIDRGGNGRRREGRGGRRHVVCKRRSRGVVEEEK